LEWSPAPHWATILYLAPSTSASSAADVQLYFVWNRSKGKSTGSDHHLAYKRYYNLVFVLSSSNLEWWPAPHWATILYLAPSISASSAASDQLYFVWNRSKGKLTGLDHHLAYKRYYNPVFVLSRSNMDWSPAPHGPPYCISRRPHRHHLLLVTNHTLFGIVAKVNQPARTIILRTVVMTTLYVKVLRRFILGWLQATHFAPFGTIRC